MRRRPSAAPQRRRERRRHGLRSERKGSIGQELSLGEGSAGGLGHSRTCRVSVPCTSPKPAAAIQRRHCPTLRTQTTGLRGACGGGGGRVLVGTFTARRRAPRRHSFHSFVPGATRSASAAALAVSATLTASLQELAWRQMRSSNQHRRLLQLLQVNCPAAAAAAGASWPQVQQQVRQQQSAQPHVDSAPSRRHKEGVKSVFV